MRYMGSKNRHSKELLPLILRERESLYVEPFCGGCNIIDKVDGQRLAADIDEDLICMWQSVSEGWLPPESITEDRYYELKTEPASPLKGYAKFALSYGGKAWGGWCRDSQGKRNYCAEAYRNAVKQFPLLKGVKFIHESYFNLDIPDGSTVYCDIPYQGTTQYKSQFNHEEFWEWVRCLSKKNHVYVSEYQAPLDFECIWEKNVTSSLTQDTGSKRNVERLFKCMN